MLNYYYGISHGMTTVHTLFTTDNMHDLMSINLKSDLFRVYLDLIVFIFNI